jgi:hypothetical protein
MAWKRSSVRTRPGPPKRFKDLPFPRPLDTSCWSPTEPITFPPDWFAGCRTLADRINRARLLLRVREPAVPTDNTN